MSARVLVEGLEHPMGERRLRAERLELSPGRVHALVGPNGAGKSTLLRLVAGLAAPERGRVQIEGAPVTLVHQRPYLFRGSVGRNVAFGLRARGVPRTEARARADAALAAVGLPDYARRPARALSGGEVQRAALARALVLQPAVLLLDEPTAGMDAGGQEMFRALVARWRGGKGPTVLVAAPAEPPAGYDALIRIEAGEVRMPT
jgi:tungstate transport system ATP-binding protein